MDSLPWYRQFWPWFIMALPATVVVAGLTTWWIAAHNADSLVADDYYKDGLAINRQLDKRRRAEELGLSADMRYETGAIEVDLAGNAWPTALTLILSHPLDADEDRQVTLAGIRPGKYRAELALPAGSRWLWQLEPLDLSGAASWRLDGELVLPDADAH